MDCWNGGRSRGVSNAVGIAILLGVAIFVMASIGLFVIGFQTEEMTTTNPNVELEYEPIFDFTGHDRLEITHQGGDVIPGEQTYIILEDTNDVDADGEYTWVELGGSERVEEGDSALIHVETVGATTDEFDLGQAHLRIIVEDEELEQEFTISRWEGPRR